MQTQLGRFFQLTIGTWLCVYLSACASPLRNATDQFRSGDYASALTTLEEKSVEIADRDLLLLHLNKGIVLHHLARYEESNQELLRAADIIEELSRTSISEQVSTLAVNDWLASYRGEYVEQLWVHSYLMMNFLLLDNSESAAVEARRALTLFASKPDALKQALFTRALIATSFEGTGLINDAYIEYKQLDEASSDNSNFVDKLYSQALQLGFAEDTKRYKQDLLAAQQSLPGSEKLKSELIIFLSQGDIPHKVSGNVFFPPDIRLSWPEYGYSYRPINLIDIYDNENPVVYKEVASDFASLARTSLYERGKTIAIKHALRAGAKHAIVHEVGNENALAGGLLQVALFVLEEADTRGWDSLPSHMSMLRIPLDPGTHTISILANGYTLKTFSPFTTRGGQRVYRHFRLEPFVGEPKPVREPRGSPVTVEYHIEKEL